jgi:flagellar biosynthesis protein FlhB
MSGITRLIAIAANLAALILIAWIVLYLFDTSTGNSFVHWIQQASDWLATWSKNLFNSVHNDKVRTLLAFGLPAVVYALVGNALHQGARRVS